MTFKTKFGSVISRARSLNEQWETSRPGWDDIHVATTATGDVIFVGSKDDAEREAWQYAQPIDSAKLGGALRRELDEKEARPNMGEYRQAAARANRDAGGFRI